MTTREAIETRLKAIASNQRPVYLHGDDLRPLAQGALELVATVEAERDERNSAVRREMEFGLKWRERAEAAEERAEALAQAVREKALEIERHCPCGARPETLTTHPHVIGCPVAKLVALQTETHDGK